jgi:hypothetical protein
MYIYQVARSTIVVGRQTSSPLGEIANPVGQIVEPAPSIPKMTKELP